MIYSNIIYLLVVMVIITTASPLAESLVPPLSALLLFIIKALFFMQTIRFIQKRKKTARLAEYLAVERNLSILALVFFGLDVYLLDLGYYLGLLPFSRQLPSLGNLTGICVFIFYLVLLWLQLKPCYEAVFDVSRSAVGHIRGKLRLYFALILPWLILNLLHDLLLLLPGATFRDFVASPWGEPLFLLLMVSAAVIWFPAALIRILGCKTMPAGEDRRLIEGFCRRQRVGFGDICLWPLLEGKILTAGVVGLVGRFRYLLITPALLQALSPEEIEAVVAHELGHVKRRHLLFYLLLFIGFAILFQFCVEPLALMLISTRLFYEILFGFEGEAETLLVLLTGPPLLLMTLLYFRYVFGFFMRNFERQADQDALEVTGSPVPLVSVFEKIARLSGNDRDRPCWHHFSIGQRVAHLLACARDSSRLKDHNLKVRASLVGYFMMIGLASAATFQVGDWLPATSPGRELAEEVIARKIEKDPDNALWHLFNGDLLAGRQQYEAAIAAFEESLRLDPDNPETLNNLAWLLLTVERPQLLDPVRALELAGKAAEIRSRSHILDTLAEAYWQNGMTELAVETELRALEDNPANSEYYRRQLEKFRLGSKS